MRELELLSVVALLEDSKDHKLLRGQVGTIVERLAPGVYEVEFSDDEGRTYVSFRQECVGLSCARNVTKIFAGFGGFSHLRCLEPGYRGSSMASIRVGWPPTLWDVAVVPPDSRTHSRRSDRRYESDS